MHSSTVELIPRGSQPTETACDWNARGHALRINPLEQGRKFDEANGPWHPLVPNPAEHDRDARALALPWPAGLEADSVRIRMGRVELPPRPSLALPAPRGGGQPSGLTASPDTVLDPCFHLLTG
jgi:hypothetical protein